MKTPDMNKIGEVIAAANAAAKAEETGVKVNPELRDMLDIYDNPAAREELRKSIEAEGVRDPIIVWKETREIVDGHNRHSIALELKKPFAVTERSFKDIAEVKEWMLRNQLGRRNLSPARFNYFLGKLYNEQKEAAVEKAAVTGETKPVTKVKETLAKQFETKPAAIERLGKQAKGVDMIEKVRGKLAAAKELGPKPDFTAEEKEIIGAASSPGVAKRVIDKVQSLKQAVKANKQEKQKVAAAVAAKATLYHVALVEPSFDVGYSVSSEPKPTLEKDSAVWMIVPDEALHLGFKLIEHWNLTYQASIIFAGSKTYDGIFTKIGHKFLILATKGEIAGPDMGKEVGSWKVQNGDVMPDVFKIIDVYHKAATRKIDMRRGAKTLAGWDSPSKAK